MKTGRLLSRNQEEGMLEESFLLAAIRICDGEVAGSQARYLRAAKINLDIYIRTLELLSLRSYLKIPENIRHHSLF